MIVGVVLVSLVGGKPQTNVGHRSLPPPSDQEVNEELLENITNVEIKCATSEIRVKIPTPHPHFNGMVYPQVSSYIQKINAKPLECKV